MESSDRKNASGPGHVCCRRGPGRCV